MKKLLIVALFSAPIPAIAPVLAQAGPPVRNLGAAAAAQVEGDWLVYSVWETFPGEDLNGDGDREDLVVHVQNLATGDTTNLGLAGFHVALSGDWLVFPVWEDLQGEDLNGDGDREDGVVHVHKLSTGETTNLGLAGFGGVPSGDWLVFLVWEGEQGEDLNGDGDREDRVDHVHKLSTGETTNLGLTGFGRFLSGDWLVGSVWEGERGEDLNGDGDRQDSVLHVHKLSTGETTNLGLAGFHVALSGDWLLFRVGEGEQGEDLNGDGDRQDSVLHVHKLSTGETTNLGLATTFGEVLFSGDWLVFVVEERDQREDLNGDGDRQDSVVHVHKLSTGETTNLRLATAFPVLSGDWLVFQVWEGDQRADLNGDGDRGDGVVHVHKLSTGKTTNLRLVSNTDLVPPFGDWLVVQVEEREQGEDLNGDGDSEDLRVVHVHKLPTGETTNLRLAAGGRRHVLLGDWLVFLVWEGEQGEDLNGDGDREDPVVHVHNLSTGETTNLGLAGDLVLLSGDWLVFRVGESQQGEDLNGDGDRRDWVVHVHKLSTGETTNLGLATGRSDWLDPFEPDYGIRLFGDWLVVPVGEPEQGEDLNGDGSSENQEHWVSHLVDLNRLSGLRVFVRGEVNADENLDISDGVSLLSFLFLGTEPPACLDSADADDNGKLQVTDAIFLFGFLFLGGDSPPPPGPSECGSDATEDELGCASPPACP